MEWFVQAGLELGPVAALLYFLMRLFSWLH